MSLCKACGHEGCIDQLSEEFVGKGVLVSDY